MYMLNHFRCRFLELHYRRGGRSQRMETTVIFLPDVWTVMPSRLEWDNLGASYKRALHKKLSPSEAAAMDQDEAAALVDDADAKRPPTHHSELDPKTMKIIELKQELEARNLSTKGLKTQLIARLSKALKSEQEQEQDSAHDEAENAMQQSDSKINEEEEKKAEEEEKRTKDLEKHYALPEEPAILVHPSRTAKSGRFDCTLMSLSLLLDYRQEDNKEHSFEVSLFAELFNEMLMRDFGFRIYRTLAEYPESKEEDEDKKEKDKKRDKKNDEKKDKKDDNKKKEEDKESDDKEDDGDSEDDEDDDRDRRKRKKKLQLYTADPFLLLSFVYFDQNHAGYIFEKDLEDIIFTLGLHLSRAQVRKLLQKVIKRDSLDYRKLTDRPVPDDSPGDFLEHTIRHEEDPGSKLEELALGNRKMLPMFSQAPESSSGMKKESISSSDVGTEDEETSEIGLVRFQGRTLDLDQLLKQLSRKDRTCLETEERMREMEEELGELKEMAMEKDKENRKLKTELDKFKSSLKGTEEDLHRAVSENDKLKKNLNISRDQLKTIVSNIDLALKSSALLGSSGDPGGMCHNGLESGSSFPSPSSRRKATKFDFRTSKLDVKPLSFAEQSTPSSSSSSGISTSQTRLSKWEPKSDPATSRDSNKRLLEDQDHEGVQTKQSKREPEANGNLAKEPKKETEENQSKQPENEPNENMPKQLENKSEPDKDLADQPKNNDASPAPQSENQTVPNENRVEHSGIMETNSGPASSSLSADENVDEALCDAEVKNGDHKTEEDTNGKAENDSPDQTLNDLGESSSQATPETAPQEDTTSSS